MSLTPSTITITTTEKNLIDLVSDIDLFTNYNPDQILDHDLIIRKSNLSDDDIEYFDFLPFETVNMARKFDQRNNSSLNSGDTMTIAILNRTDRNINLTYPRAGDVYNFSGNTIIARNGRICYVIKPNQKRTFKLAFTDIFRDGETDEIVSVQINVANAFEDIKIVEKIKIITEKQKGLVIGISIVTILLFLLFIWCVYRRHRLKKIIKDCFKY